MRQGATTLIDDMSQYRAPRVDSWWVTMESLRLALNWGLWDAVSVVTAGARRYEVAPHAPAIPRMLSLEFGESILRLSHGEATTMIRAAIRAHVPQWRFEADAHFSAMRP